MMHHLEMPDPFAAADIDGNQAVGKQIVARSVTPIIGGGGRGERYIHIAEFFVSAQTTPGAKVTGITPGIIAPGIGAEFTFFRHGMESPQQFACSHVIATHIFRSHPPPIRASVTCPVDSAGYDNHLVHQNRATGNKTVRPGRFWNQIYPAIVSEIGRHLTRFRI